MRGGCIRRLNPYGFLVFSHVKNIGTLSVQELFFQLIGWLKDELGVFNVSPAGMVYFMG